MRDGFTDHRADAMVGGLLGQVNESKVLRKSTK